MQMLGTIFSLLNNELIVKSDSKNLRKLGSKVYYKKQYVGKIVEYFGNTNSPFYVVFIKNEKIKSKIKKGEKVFVGETNDRSRGKRLSCLRK